MAREPEKDDRREKARGLLRHGDRSKKMRDERDESKGEGREEKREHKDESKGEPEKKPTEAGDKTEGGEKRRKPGEAKPDDAMAGGHKAARVALAAKHIEDRLKLHGEHRREHREMDEAHEGELAALRHAA